MLTDDEVAELAALRARAFGPDADLTDDPAGLSRLNELEDRARVPVPDPGAVHPVRGEEPAVPPAADHVVSSPATSAAPAVGLKAVTAPESSTQTRPSSAPAASAAARSDARASSDHASSPASAGDEAAAPSDAEAAADGASPPVAPGHRPRRGWSRRAVLLVGIPIVAVACAVGVGVGAVVVSQAAGTTPSPSTTLAAGYVASLRSVSEMHTWDGGSPRLLADLSGTLVWEGTTAAGSVTCVVVDDASQPPLSACEATDALTTGGVGVSVADPRTNATRTYVAWPHGAPTVTYSSDDPNPSP
jgi:hypothetical protein